MLDHPLFQEHPPSGSQKISVGRVPVPYQTYDGHGTPMGVWVVDFTEASLGPHKELRFVEHFTPFRFVYLPPK